DKKKQELSKQTKKDHRRFRYQLLHEHLNNININVVYHIRYHDTIDLQTNQDFICTNYFLQSLEHWSTINFGEAYSILYNKFIPSSGSFEQVC
ncbi:unnamed protein product, partial [Rotaria sp. Silwood1]